MVHFADFGFQIEMFALIVFVYGLFFLVRVLINIEDKFKGAIFFFILAFVLHISEGFFHWYFLNFKSLEDGFFLVFTHLLNLLEVVLFLVGAKKLYRALKK